MAKMKRARDAFKEFEESDTESVSSSDSSVENVKINNPQPKSTVKITRGLANAVNLDDDFDDSVPGIYTSQLNKFCTETKPNLEKQIEDKMRQEVLSAATKKKKKSPNCTEVSLESEVWSPVPIPAPPALRLDDPSLLYSSSWGPLLKDIETTQLAIQQRQTLNVLEDTFNDDGADVYVKLTEDESSKKITVLVTYRLEITKHIMSMNENFSKLIKELAIKHNIHPSQVLLSLNGNFITSRDTPASFGLQIADILDFGIGDILENEDSENKLLLKVQSKDFRSKMDIAINKDDPLSKLMNEYARRTNANLSDLVFKFDGDKIDPSHSATDLDLEEGYCIDVSIKK